MGDIVVGWNVGLMVGFWDVGAKVCAKEGLIDGVLVGILVVGFFVVGDFDDGWNVGLMVGFWDVGARVGENDVWFNGVLVEFWEGEKDGIKLGFSTIRGKLEEVGAFIVDEVIEEVATGVVSS